MTADVHASRVPGAGFRVTVCTEGFEVIFLILQGSRYGSSSGFSLLGLKFSGIAGLCDYGSRVKDSGGLGFRVSEGLISVLH